MVGDDDAVGAKAHGVLGVLGVQDALDDHGPLPEGAYPFEVLPGNGGIEVGAQPADVVGQARGAAPVGRDVAQVMRAAQQAHVHGPGRVRDRLPVAAHGGIRAAHARMRIAVARAGHGHVHGEDQGGAAGRLGTLQRVLHEAPVLEHIELEPHGALDLGRHLFDGADRDRGHGERNAMGVGRARGLHFAAAAVHARQAHGRQRHGDGQLLAEQLDAGVQPAHVLEHALAQRHGGQVFHIAAQRLLGIGAAVDVVEQERRQALLRRCTVVGGGGDDHDGCLMSFVSGLKWAAARARRPEAAAWSARAARGPRPGAGWWCAHAPGARRCIRGRAAGRRPGWPA